MAQQRDGIQPTHTRLSLIALAAGLIALIESVGVPAIGLAQDASSAGVAYRDLPQAGGSRNVIWVVAQLHLLLAGFVLGVPIFAWLCEIVGWKSGDKRYDKLAKEFTKLLTSSYATTALFGGILLFLLIGFYPKSTASCFSSKRRRSICIGTAGTRWRKAIRKASTSSWDCC